MAFPNSEICITSVYINIDAYHTYFQKSLNLAEEIQNKNVFYNQF